METGGRKRKKEETGRNVSGENATSACILFSLHDFIDN